jgi:hypothetical protein
MWIIALGVHLLINGLFYLIFLKYSSNRIINITFMALFIGFTLVMSVVNQELMHYFHSLVVSFMFYVFLVVSLIDFTFLDQSSLPVESIKSNLRILVGIGCSILSANIYTSYL